MLEQMMWPYRLSRVEALLVEERRLLAMGDVPRLAALSDRRSALVEGLVEMPAEIARQQVARLTRIQAAAKMNTRLIGAYLDGARQGAARLQALEHAEQTLGTYGRDGIRPTLGGGELRRRA